MIRFRTLFIFLLLLSNHFVQGQETAPNSNTPKGSIVGSVIDAKTKEPLIGVLISLENTNPLIGTATDINGKFKLSAVPGSYNLKATSVGYKSAFRYNLVITTGNANEVNLELQEDAITTNDIVVNETKRQSARASKVETPLSIQSLSTEEIKANPGGNFDISRVIQVLPGVAGTTGGGGFRNDIIIRGGAPNENVFYLDGIEIPVINHFTTQGSAGGPVGILNVSFIEDVTLSSSAFEARYDNPLASVFQFKQKEGNSERLQGNIRLSATELAGTFEGPLAPKTTFLASVRRSYLQLLFQAIDLPIRPNYWDFQYKVTHKLDKKTTISAIGVGAIDEFSFAVPRNATPDNEFVLRASPSIEQWNYTAGISVRRSIEDGFMNLAISRNAFQNNLDRFQDARNGDENFRALKARSNETENKLRFDVTKFFGSYKFSAGIMTQYVQFRNSVFSRIRNEVRDGNGLIVSPEVVLNFNSAINFWRYGAFAQLSKSVLDDRLSLSAGVRTDMNSFTTTGNNPLRTLSPRVSASYALNEFVNLNASVGTYFKVPIYTVLGFRDNAGNLVNRDALYTQSTHYVAGIEYSPVPATRFTVESFYKRYNNYAVSVRDGISLANQGGEFGAIGNEAVNTNGNGRAYGAEFYFQQKLVKTIYAVFSYTFVRSEFSGANGQLIASAWDNRHLISALLGKKFKKGWEMGLKYRFAGGAPFTPFDEVSSRVNYLATGNGVLDFNRLNSRRLGAFNQFDFRLDKKINFRRLTLDLYFDVQNAFVFANPAFPRYTWQRTPDNSGFATSDGAALQADGSNALPLILPNDDPSVIPTIGFILEF